MKKKITITIICAVLSCVCLIGTTFAWLVDKTDPVENTFTVGDINITLTETEATYKMLPGNDITKDPKVTVTKGSEDCWLFVKIEKSANFGDYMTFTVASGWTELTAGSGIYYRQVDANESADQPFNVLDGNKVSVLESVTKAQLETAKTNAPTLTFTAYAVQRDSNINTAEEAWQVATTGSLT